MEFNVCLETVLQGIPVTWNNRLPYSSFKIKATNFEIECFEFTWNYKLYNFTGTGTLRK